MIHTRCIRFLACLACFIACISMMCCSKDKYKDKKICKITVISKDWNKSIKYSKVSIDQFRTTGICAVDTMFWYYFTNGGDTFQHCYMYLHSEFLRAKVYRFDNDNGSLLTDTMALTLCSVDTVNDRPRYSMYNGPKLYWPSRMVVRYWIWQDSTLPESKIDTVMNVHFFRKSLVSFDSLSFTEICPKR